MGEYKQTSFAGGLNLLLDDTRLPVSFKYKEGDTPYDISYNQYRLGLNCRTRFDVCSPVLSSIEDTTAPAGLKQAIITFGNYIIIFVAGKAYYRLNTFKGGWTQIDNFSMSITAPRYWTVAVPLSTTLYGRLATAPTTGNAGNASANLPIIQANQIAGLTTFGNIPGLLVQDGVNQPQFIYLAADYSVQCRTTQTYDQWSFPIDNSTLQLTGLDQREYVPVGTFMEWFNGILFIVSPDFNTIYRSVSGRPLDFVINVDIYGQKGGDATTTSYSVGVNGITAIRATPGNALFVAAGGSANFLITLNQTPNAPTIFGEYTFNRQVLFTANCLTERGIVDIPGNTSANNSGDTVFIDANGLRSFNSILAQQNEGRNSVFSSLIQKLFTDNTGNVIIPQTTTITESLGSGWSAAVIFDNYVIFSVNTIYGYVLVIYDTINSTYQGLDIYQTNGHAVKQFAAITVSTLALYAITDNDKFIQLYGGSEYDTTTIRLGAINPQDPRKEIKVQEVRAIFANITEDTEITCSLFTDNRYDYSITSKISYKDPLPPYTGIPLGPDVGTQTNPILFSFPNSRQGWKAFIVLSWTGSAALNSMSATTSDELPMQPSQTQAVIQQN